MVDSKRFLCEKKPFTFARNYGRMYLQMVNSEKTVRRRKQIQSLKATIFDKRGRPISVGHNSYWKTHPMQYELSKEYGNGEQIYLHAEIDAIVRLKDWSQAHSIKVERYLKNGQPAMAKPCNLCQKALEKVGIHTIEWTTELSS